MYSEHENAVKQLPYLDNVVISTVMNPNRATTLQLLLDQSCERKLSALNCWFLRCLDSSSFLQMLSLQHPYYYRIIQNL